MKRLMLIIVVSFVIAIIYISRFIPDESDPFYRRFTTGRQSSLVIGSSRAAQGIVPGVMNLTVEKIRSPIYNFSFTVYHSPYGRAYTNAIRNKLENSWFDKKAVFIMEINPSALMVQKPESVYDWEFMLPERKSFMGLMYFFNLNPNLDYVFRRSRKPLYTLPEEFSREMSKQYRIHDDGWFEVDIDMDQTRVKERISEKIEVYDKEFQKTAISEVRLNSLRELTQYLSTRGKVFWVRMPIAPELLNLENRYIPEFSQLIISMARELNVSYEDFSDNKSKYKTTDGNHLYKEDSVAFTKELDRLISQKVQ